MKKIAAILITFVFCISARAQREQWKPLDDKYGFKDLKFGMKEAEVMKNKKILKIKPREPGTVTYKILDPKYLSVGDCALKNVEICFFKGDIMSFYIETAGITNSTCFLDAFNTSFGQGFQSNKHIDNFAWLGEKTTAMYNTLNSITGDGYMNISSNSLRDNYEKFIAERAKTNSGDL